MCAARGWAVDFMRRASDAPNGAMEYTIAETLNRLQARGDQVVSLGLAALPRVGYALVNAQMPNFSLNDMAKLVRPS